MALGRWVLRQHHVSFAQGCYLYIAHTRFCRISLFTENHRLDKRFIVGKIKGSGMKIVQAVFLATGIFASSALLHPARSEISPDLRDALNTLEPVVNEVFSRCTVGGVTYMVTAVRMPQIQPNPFTPILPTPGAPPAGSIGGYYEIALYLSKSGHYIMRMTTSALSITGADELNGIDARFQVDLYAKAYRIYDMRTGHWGAWTTEGSFGNDVQLGSFTLQRQHRTWGITGGFSINTNGNLTAADCSALPPT
jgi:hypothetical protein